MSSAAAMWSPLLFGFALFLSSGLLFLVQPMIGRSLLPHLGGSPLAWNTCLVFFQATLLAGYLYADLLHRFRGLRWQTWTQLILLSSALFLCYIGVFGEDVLNDLAPRLTSLDTLPILSTIALLVLVIGVPFLLLAAVGPLVTRWFAHLDHPRASDPYFFFVASNLGAMTALVMYPATIEPNAPMVAQWLAWKLGLTALGFLLLLVAICAWMSPRNPELEPPPKTDDPNAPMVPKLIGRGPATWSRRLFWLTASALPVALMMGVTDYLTLDVGPAPMLWALPFALYLIAFSQSFGRYSALDHGGFAYKLSLQILLCLFLGVGLMVLTMVVITEGGRDETGLGVLMVLCFVLILIAPRTWFAVLQPITVVLVVLDQANLFPTRALAVPQLGLHLLCFYTSARLCLGMLADERPAAPALTTYFTWIGIGGLCGGLFQLLIAPLLFRHGYLEYSLLAALASMMRPAWTLNGLTDWAFCTMLFPKKEPNDPTPTRRKVGYAVDIAFALAVGIIAAAMFYYYRGIVRPPQLFARGLATLFVDFPLVLVVFLSAVLYLRPMRFGIALVLIVLLSAIGNHGRSDEKLLVRQRTPGGIVRVTERLNEVPRVHQNFPPQDPDPDPLRDFTERTLWHGYGEHGSSVIDPPSLRRYPTTFYHELGPAGRVMLSTAWFTMANNDHNDWRRHHANHLPNDARIAASLVGLATGALGTSPFPMEPLMATWSEPPYAIVGLGAGSLYAYAHPYQWVDSYEINPAVVALSTSTQATTGRITLTPEIGQETPVFHFVQDAQKRGVQGQILLGDARRNLAKPGREGFYQMIFVDASSSQAAPTHLLTEEAMVVNFQKLAPDGILCFHVSNRHLDLPFVLERVGQRLDVPTRTLMAFTEKANVPAFSASTWVVMARNQDTMNRWVTRCGLDRLDRGKGGFPFDNRFNRRLPVSWTDDNAAPNSALRSDVGWKGLVYGLLVVIMIFAWLQGIVEIVVSMLTPTRPVPPAKPVAHSVA